MKGVKRQYRCILHLFLFFGYRLGPMGIPATRHRTNQNPFWGYNVMEIRRMDILQRGENPHALIECLICGHVSTATFPSVPAVEWLGIQVGTSDSLPHAKTHCELPLLFPCALVAPSSRLLITSDCCSTAQQATTLLL